MPPTPFFIFFCDFFPLEINVFSLVCRGHLFPVVTWLASEEVWTSFQVLQCWYKVLPSLIPHMPRCHIMGQCLLKSPIGSVRKWIVTKEYCKKRSLKCSLLQEMRMHLWGGRWPFGTFRFTMRKGQLWLRVAPPTSWVCINENHHRPLWGLYTSGKEGGVIEWGCSPKRLMCHQLMAWQTDNWLRRKVASSVG